MAKPVQMECPHCHTFKTYDISGRVMIRNVGLVGLLVGFMLLLFVIGIPFFIMGAVLVIISLFVPYSGKMRCRNCNFIWYKEKTV